MEKETLIQKYNVAGPRYTSYPTVPFWEADSFSPIKWQKAIREKFSANREEISLYIHLPYCESLCTFCGCNTRITVNHKVETPYIETVLREWDLYLSMMNIRPVIKEIHLGGGTPTFFSPDNLKKLINGITSRTKVAHHAEFGFEGHPNNTTKEHLQTLYDLGFRRVSFGIQDFDPKVQQVINRIQTFEKVQEVTENARAIGYTSINYDIIYGLPLQKVESVVDTINKVGLLKPDRIAFYSYAHVPWLKPGQRKFTELDLPEDSVKRNLYETGLKMLENLGYYEIGMDHFALKTDGLFQAVENKTLHRNFMGYTTATTSASIGLGVSAISDIWGAFAQNVKTVEEYKSIVQQGQIPVFRGHFLTNEDLVIRQHILNIMCRFETNWLDANMQTPSLFRGIDNLYELEKDGLIEIGLNDLTVTEKGRPFVRNICMALDARMHDASHQDAKFSKVI